MQLLISRQKNREWDFSARNSIWNIPLFIFKGGYWIRNYYIFVKRTPYTNRLFNLHSKIWTEHFRVLDILRFLVLFLVKMKTLLRFVVLDNETYNFPSPTDPVKDYPWALLIIIARQTCAGDWSLRNPGIVKSSAGTEQFILVSLSQAPFFDPDADPKNCTSA